MEYSTLQKGVKKKNERRYKKKGIKVGDQSII